MLFTNSKINKIPVRPRLWVLKKALITLVFGAFYFKLSPQVALKVAAGGQSLAIFYFTAMSTSPKRYRKATLVIPDDSSKDKRWYIIYYATDKEGKYKRFRELDCNKITDLEARKDYCTNRIQAINEALAHGPIVTSETPKPPKEYPKAKIAIENIIKSRVGLRKHTIDNYNGYANNLFKYIDFLKVEDITINRINHEFVLAFRKYLSDERNLANRTINNHMEHLKTVFKWIIKTKVIRDNPFMDVELLPEDIGRNIAYTQDETKKLLKFMEERKPQFLFLCQFMYYTLMRSNEIAHCKIGDIGRFHPDQIYVPAAVSKNGKYRNVTIPAPLAKILEKLDIKSYPADYYLFSKGIVPGKSFYSAKDLADRYRDNVLRPLKFGTDHTLYSWKHTGVVNLYMAGASKYAIQMQIGHVNTDSFDTYLKSLGLFENTEIKNFYPELSAKAGSKVKRPAKRK